MVSLEEPTPHPELFAFYDLHSCKHITSYISVLCKTLFFFLPLLYLILPARIVNIVNY